MDETAEVNAVDDATLERLTEPFDFALPDDLIARHPPDKRGDSRLLVVDPAMPSPSDARFADLPSMLAPNDLVVVNDVRVMRARVRGAKASGGAVEVLVERVLDARRVRAMVRASKSPKPGTRLALGSPPNAFEVEVAGRDGALFELTLVGDSSDWPSLLEAAGEMPLPPYLDRAAEASDDERYQTVFARRVGAVAAPTAGLHFSADTLAALDARGLRVEQLTLNVGAGTFAPLRVDAFESNALHAEWMQVPASLCEAVAECRRAGGRVVAVGTTCVRALETAARSGELIPWQGDTQLFIRPGFRFRCVDALLTNFHLPRSSLLMLVSAFAGRERTLAAYAHAVAARYRFYSYGDAMFIPSRAGP